MFNTPDRNADIDKVSPYTSLALEDEVKNSKMLSLPALFG